MHSGVLRVARGGSGAKAPPLAVRPNINVASTKILGLSERKIGCLSLGQTQVDERG